MKVKFHDTSGQHNYFQFRKDTYQHCDPNKTIVLYCYSTININSIDNIREFWHPEILKFSKKFTPILVGLKDNLTCSDPSIVVTDVTVKNVAKKIKAHDWQKCDSFLYTNSEKAEGNVGLVFKTALASHIVRELPIPKDGNCICDRGRWNEPLPSGEAEESNGERYSLHVPRLPYDYAV